MPTYTYFCQTGHRNEAVRRIAERDDCPDCFCGLSTERRITPTMVAVFAPYVTAAFDKETGKRVRIKNADEHRAFLTRNGYEEVGNDKSMAPLPQEEVAYRRKQALKEQAADPNFEFNVDTHEASTGETA